MIQRIQTVYFFIALTLISLSVAVPFVQLFDIDGNFQNITILQINPLMVSSYLLYSIFGIICLSFVLHIECVFLYKNRKKQIQHTIVNVVLLIIISLLLGVCIYMIKESSKSPVSIGIAAVLPIVAAILNFLAVLRIKKDDELVRSYDRLR